MDYMRDKGAAVLQNGYPLIPLVVGEKRPAIDGWRNVEATEQIIAGWTGGIGIRTGTVLFIDIDIPNPVADRLRQVCRELLGPAPIRIGRAPKLGMMYRAAAIFKTRLSTVYRDPDKNRCAIEALADGRQFVAWNIHPDTGQPYYWLEGLTPETLPLSELTVVTEAQVTKLFQAFDRIALEEGWGRLSGTATGGSTPTGDELPAARRREPLGMSDTKIREALMAVPNDRRFDAREDWFKIGCAVHHETGGSEFGREIWNEWSEQHPSHDEGNFRKAWDSMGLRYGQEADEPITFRYVLGLLRDQRKADLAIKLNEIGWSINIAGNLDDLRGIASTLAGMDIDTVQREAFVSDIKETARLLGIKLPVATVRQMLKPRPDEVEMPEWLVGWAFLQETEQFYNIKTRAYIGKHAFDFTYSRYLDDVAPSRFATQIVKIPVYYMTAYLPGERAIYVDPAGLTYLNTYRELAPEIPAAYSARDLANIEIVKNHATHLFGPGRERDIAILHSVLAYIVQTRKRINWLLLIQGAEQIGKTFYAQLLRAVLGKGPHVHELTTEVLTESHFTDWAEGHLVVYIEELMLHGKRYDVLNKMKPYIANEYVNIHGKYRAPHDALNTISYLAFTNFRDAIPITDGDTRHFVLLSQWQNGDQVRQFKADNPAYYPRLWAALEESAGALRRWLLEYELHAEFNPNNRAPTSYGRDLVIAEAKPDLQHQIEDLLADGNAPGVSNDLVIVSLLRQALADESGMVPTPEAIRAILKRLQFTPVNGGMVKVSDAAAGIRGNVYCWSRNQEVLASTTGQLRQRIVKIFSLLKG
jgi:hypothetical protein